MFNGTNGTNGISDHVNGTVRISRTPIDLRTDSERRLDHVAGILNAGRRDAKTMRRLADDYLLNIVPDDMVDAIVAQTLDLVRLSS